MCKSLFSFVLFCFEVHERDSGSFWTRNMSNEMNKTKLKTEK